MRIALNWLSEYVSFDMDVDELAHRFTMLGLDIEAVERIGEGVCDVVVGEIRSIDPHPDADKLVVCRTDVGAGEPLQIVCGAKNMSVGDRVPTALVGGTLPGGLRIGRRKMRGIESAGMMCSPKELGLGEDQSGLLIMDTDFPPGTDVRPLLGLDEVVFDVEVTPNRGDWASMIGVARELAAMLGTTHRRPDVSVRESQPPARDVSSVTIENPELCARYIGRVLRNVEVGPSPAWLVRRLIAAGQRPISNIVDITNFVLLETGHPLHAFDLDKLAENRIVVRNARAGETLKTIDDQVRELTPEMLIIADAEKPVAVAGVMGGFDSQVGEGTTNVLLESAYFDPVSIRQTARQLGVQTEASARFQRGADVEMALYAANRAAGLMQELAGAEVMAGVLDEYPAPPEPKQVTLRYARTDLLLGTVVAPETQKKAVLDLDFRLVDESEEGFTVEVPTWRHDVTHEADLIEEVARLFGYDNIELKVPSVRQTEQVFAPHDACVNELRQLLVSQGLTEFFLWTFSCPEDVKKARLDEDRLDMVKLENPLSENHATMRSSLIPSMLATVSRNLRHGNENVAAFELGPVYKPLLDNDLPEQNLHLAIVLTGNSEPQHWGRIPRAFDFYDLRGYAEAIFDFFGATCAVERAEWGTFAPGVCCSLTYDRDSIGALGQVAQDVLEAFDIEQPTYILEMTLDRLLDHEKPPVRFQEIPTMPPSLRDLAILVDSDVPAGDVRDAAQDAGGKILRRVEIFDVYRGKQVPDGKKSLALNLVFQAPDRTLTDKNTQKIFDRILKRLETDFKAELR